MEIFIVECKFPLFSAYVVSTTSLLDVIIAGLVALELDRLLNGDALAAAADGEKFARN